MLKTIGIEKGKPFKPDAKTKSILDKAVQEAHEVIALKYENGFAPPFFEGTHWGVPIPKETRDGLGSMFADPNEYGVDGRAVMYHMAYFSPKVFGGGQFYLISINDSAGKPLEGNKTYRLKVPPNAPIEQYWSATAYDRETHALIRGVSRPSLASNDTAVQKNADGSVDVYFGPAAPAGKESNWVPTDPKRQFEVLFRLYGPKKALFDKTWKLPDIEQVRIAKYRESNSCHELSLALLALVATTIGISSFAPQQLVAIRPRHRRKLRSRRVRSVSQGPRQR